MMRIGSAEFLILGRGAASSIRSWDPWLSGLDEPSLRRIVLPAIDEGKLVDRRSEARGKIFVIETLLRGGSVSVRCRFDLCWGVDEVGNPKKSPDGKRRAVFLVAATRV